MEQLFKVAPYVAGLRFGRKAIFYILPNRPWFKDFNWKTWSGETKFILLMIDAIVKSYLISTVPTFRMESLIGFDIFDEASLKYTHY